MTDTPTPGPAPAATPPTPDELAARRQQLQAELDALDTAAQPSQDDPAATPPGPITFDTPTAAVVKESDQAAPETNPDETIEPGTEQAAVEGAGGAPEPDAVAAARSAVPAAIVPTADGPVLHPETGKELVASLRKLADDIDAVLG